MTSENDRNQVALNHSSFFIVDNQYLTRQGTRSMLENQLNLRCVGDADAGMDKWKRAALQNMPDLLVVDYLPEEEPEACIDQLSHLRHFMKILVISDDQQVRRINKCIQNGIDGYLTKSCDEEEIREAVQKIMNGKKFICNKVLDLIMNNDHDGLMSLSERELEVLELIVKGYTTKSIAEQLHLSIHTVNSHRKNMLKKLGFKSPTQLISYAISQGLHSL